MFARFKLLYHISIKDDPEKSCTLKRGVKFDGQMEWFVTLIMSLLATSILTDFFTKLKEVFIYNMSMLCTPAFSAAAPAAAL